MFIAIREPLEMLMSDWLLVYGRMQWHRFFFVSWLSTSNSKLKDMRLSRLWCLTILTERILQFSLFYSSVYITFTSKEAHRVGWWNRCVRGVVVLVPLRLLWRGTFLSSRRSHCFSLHCFWHVISGIHRLNDSWAKPAETLFKYWWRCQVASVNWPSDQPGERWRVRKNWRARWVRLC